MEVEDKYFSLLNLLVYDKRAKECGMISSLKFDKLIGGVCVYYEAYYHCGKYRSVFVEDIKSGNVVFLIPFSVYEYDRELYKQMGEAFISAVKEFFGEEFREDMIMEISEEERQEEIRRWEKLTRPIDNWDRKLKRDETDKEG